MRMDEHRDIHHNTHSPGTGPSAQSISPKHSLPSWLNTSRPCLISSLLEPPAQPHSYNSPARDAEKLVVLQFMLIQLKSKSDNWIVRQAQQAGWTQAAGLLFTVCPDMVGKPQIPSHGAMALISVEEIKSWTLTMGFQVAGRVPLCFRVLGHRCNSHNILTTEQQDEEPRGIKTRNKMTFLKTHFLKSPGHSVKGWLSHFQLYYWKNSNFSFKTFKYKDITQWQSYVPDLHWFIFKIKLFFFK